MSEAIPSWCRVGQRVVCIERGPEPNRRWVRYPTVGVTYSIREVFDHPLGGVGIYLAEIVNPVLPYESGRHEAIWKIGRFRPAVEDKSDDEIERRLFRKHRLESPVSQRLVAS